MKVSTQKLNNGFYNEKAIEELYIQLNKELGEIKITLVDSKGKKTLVSKSTKSFKKDTYTIIFNGFDFIGNIQITN